MKITKTKIAAFLSAFFAERLCASAQASDWTQLGGGPDHAAISETAPPNLNTTRWIAEPLPDEEFVANASPVIEKGRVYISARIFDDFTQDANAIICFDEQTGSRIWRTLIPADFQESWSSLAIHTVNSSIIAATDRTLTALNTFDGELLWSLEPGGRIVNSSPTISCGLFNHSKPANRVYISNFYAAPGGGAPAALYAINVDQYDADGNPYQPGEVVWSKLIDRPQGSTAAYQDGSVFIATTTGKVYSFDALTGKQNWVQTVSNLRSHGGVTVSDGAVYMAGYNFNPGQNNARLVKLNASNGSLIWTTACERTDSIPVVIGDGRIVVSGGIGGPFGSATKVQMFIDHGTSVSLAWDTHADTGGSLNVGGWSTQPVYSRGNLLVGQPPVGDLSPYLKLYQLNIDRVPGQAGFIRSERAGAGGSPAIDGQSVYSIGTAGLLAIGRYLTSATHQ